MGATIELSVGIDEPQLEYPTQMLCKLADVSALATPKFHVSKDWGRLHLYCHPYFLKAQEFVNSNPLTLNHYQESLATEQAFGGDLPLLLLLSGHQEQDVDKVAGTPALLFALVKLLQTKP
nr:hypothetical protein Iba_chr02bCG17970 [Ipomoea batatas]